MPALSERFEMRLDQETLQGVDEWRSRQGDLPSRAEAIRRLIEKGLGGSDSGSPRFSAGETLLVHMVCDLLRGSKAKTDFDVDFIQRALLGGHLWALDMEMTGTFHKHVDNRSNVSEVLNILDMWDFIELSYEKLDRKDKARVEKEAEPFGRDPKFLGFDGNNESEHVGIAMFLVRDMDRFARFKNRELDSHFPTSLEGYRRMYRTFEPVRTTRTGKNMTAAQIIEVLNQRAHPTQRGKK